MTEPDSTPYQFPVRVYYEDTDAGGVVYYANYLKFMERARTEWLSSLGYEQDVLIEELGIAFMVRAVDIRYRKPALFNERLLVSVEIEKVGKVQIVVKQQVTRDGGVLVEGMVNLACVDAGSYSPKRIPSVILDGILSRPL